MAKFRENRSRAKRIKILFKEQKAKLGSYKEMANFKEPILMLIRRSGKVEWYDDVSKGKFMFTHTDGKERNIELSPEYLKTFDYGKRTFRGYVCDEDRPIPLPEKPLMTIDSYEMGIVKTLNDMSKWKQKEYEGLGQMWINIAIAVAIVVGVIVLAKMMGVDITSFAKGAFSRGNSTGFWWSLLR